ncbi:hypothetical protein EBQ93_04430, partial [bacterium]|nr:hypothetical protein [bacterium]
MHTTETLCTNWQSNRKSNYRNTTGCSQTHRVDEIVCPEIQTATQLADSLYSEFSNLVRLDPQFAIGTIKAPHDFIDKTVHEIQLYEQFKINCIAIKRDDEYITAHPQHIILEDDELVVAGKYNKLRAIIAE